LGRGQLDELLARKKEQMVKGDETKELDRLRN